MLEHEYYSNLEKQDDCLPYVQDFGGSYCFTSKP